MPCWRSAPTRSTSGPTRSPGRPAWKPRSGYTSADDLRAPLRRAIESGLVRRVDPVDPSTEDAATVDFSHDLYREVRYADLPEADRRATHRRIAQVLRDTG